MQMTELNSTKKQKRCKKISHTKQYNHLTLVKKCRWAWRHGDRNKEKMCQYEAAQ